MLSKYQETNEAKSLVLFQVKAQRYSSTKEGKKIEGQRNIFILLS